MTGHINPVKGVIPDAEFSRNRSPVTRHQGRCVKPLAPTHGVCADAHSKLCRSRSFCKEKRSRVNVTARMSVHPEGQS